jgi:transcriptional regulator with XRE-family HTH domain
MANRVLESSGSKHREGPLLRALIEPKVRPADIARVAGCSRAYVSQVLSGQARASARFIDACRELGLPVDLIFTGDDVAGNKASRDNQTNGESSAHPRRAA